jgi:cell division transport system permease protein
MLEAGLQALMLILEPTRLLIMTGGVVLGLALGVIPGLGGVVGLAILIPFTYHLDAYSAFALLLGMASVTTISDLIPAVLFGVPGTVGAAATVLDGHPMAKRGEAARAFGAGYGASLIGGLFGAVLLVAGSASEWQSDVAREMTIQVRPVSGRDIEADVKKATDLARAAPGVVEVRPYTRAESARLLEPWLGTGLALDDLPVPRLVTLDLDKDAPASAAELQEALKADNIDAVVDDHSLWIKDIVRAGLWARAAAIGVFALTACAAAAVIAYAARSALAARHEIVEVLHVSGAQDQFIAGLLLRRFAGMAFGAGVLAAAAAAAVGAGARALGGGEGLTPALPVAWIDLAALLPCPLLAALVAALAARFAALNLLKSMAMRDWA